MSVLLTADALQATDAQPQTPGTSSVEPSRSNAASIVTDVDDDGLMEGAAEAASPLIDLEHPSASSSSGLDTSSPESNDGGGEKQEVAAGLETRTSAHIEEGAMMHRLNEASALAAEAAQDPPSRTGLQENDFADSEQQLQNDSMAAMTATPPQTRQVPSSSEQPPVPASNRQAGVAEQPQQTAAEGQPGGPVNTADQFSIEIVRCRAVCPDWRDVALVEASTTGRPDTLVLGIPYLLLQLPPKDPAQHPRRHPVQVSNFAQVPLMVVREGTSGPSALHCPGCILPLCHTWRQRLRLVRLF